MNQSDTGRLIASILTRSWRPQPPEPTVTAAELAEVAPILKITGAGGLGWWRVRRTVLGDSAEGKSLREVFGRQAMRQGLYEASVAEAVALVRATGIEMIVVKGVSLNQRYPSKGLRQCGDIDLVVRPEQHAAAAQALEARRLDKFKVDLSHEDYELLTPSELDALFTHCEALDVAGVSVPVLEAEESLRQLCVHFIRHFGYRPLWLCDIAATLETLPEGFDWDRCLGPDRRVANWVRTAAELACHVLGAEPRSGSPEFNKPPDWVVADMLELWGAGHVSAYLPSYAPYLSMRSALGATGTRPLEPLRAVRVRWLSPLEFTVMTRRPFAKRPPVAPRVGDGLRRAARFLKTGSGE